MILRFGEGASPQVQGPSGFIGEARGIETDGTESEAR